MQYADPNNLENFIPTVEYNTQEKVSVLEVHYYTDDVPVPDK